MSVFIIIIKEKTSNEIIDIVSMLKNKGLQIDVDFNFEYCPGYWDWANLKTIPRQTKFTFYNEEAGTLFALQYL